MRISDIGCWPLIFKDRRCTDFAKYQDATVCCVRTSELFGLSTITSELKFPRKTVLGFFLLLLLHMEYE
jgi:hypothetical protein